METSFDRYDVLLVLVVLLGIGSLPGVLSGLRELPTFVASKNEEINDGGESLQAWASVAGAWQESPDGLALSPGGRGSVSFTIDKRPEDNAALELWFYARGGLVTRVECSGDGIRYRTLASNVDLAGDFVDLAGCGRGSSRVEVRLYAELPADQANMALAIDRIGVRTYRGQLSASLRALAAIPILLSLLITAALIRRIARAAGAARGLAIAIGLGSLLIFLAGYRYHPRWYEDALETPFGPFSGAFALLLSATVVLGTLWWARSGPHLGRLRPLVGLAALTIVTYGVGLRTAAVADHLLEPLWPDVLAVLEIAEAMEHPYDTSHREPLWLWVAQPWLHATTREGMRYFSLGLSIALLPVVFLLVLRYSKRWILALVALALVTRHPYLVESSVQGHRTELYLVLLVLLSYFTFVRDLSASRRTFGLAVSVAGLALTQLTYLVAGFPAILWCKLRYRLSWLQASIPVLLTLCLVVPHLAQVQQRFGHPPLYWKSVMIGTWYRNYEYMAVRGTGCEGCPTPEEYAAGSYSGSPITTGGYIFGMHPLTEVARRVLDGFGDIFLERGELLHRLLGSRSWAIYVSYLVGLLWMCTRRYRELYVIPVLSINLLAFVIPLGVDVRLLTPIVPFHAIAIAWPITAMVEFLVRSAELPTRLSAGSSAPSASRS